MLFSVIIPTYDRRELLREALASVRAQRFPDYEVIVVDDGSDDGTAEALAGEGDWLRVLSQPNLGPGSARNRGAEVARGEYLAFLDSDDLWFPWTLEVFSTLIERHERPAFLAALCVDFVDMNELSEIAEVPARGEVYADYLGSSRAGCVVSGGAFVVSRRSFQLVGGFSAQIRCAEDHDLALRLGLAPGFVQVKAPVTLAHRRHPGSAVSDENDVLEGIRHLFLSEREGRYPGGTRRSWDRRRLLTLHARPVALERLRAGDFASATQIYWRTLRWHLRDLRIRFLVGFPVLALGRLLFHRQP